MLRPVTRTNRGQRARPFTLPAPVGGLNGRDGLANMPPLDAFVLDNWFVNSTTVDTRNGSDVYTPDLGVPVETLAVYTGGAGARMLAFADGNVYNVSAPGAPGAALLSGRNSDYVSSFMFSNAGNQFLLCFSGADQPFAYNSTSGVTMLTITGLTGSQNTLHGGMIFKGRVYLAQKDQLGFYYLAPGAIQGAASYYDLSQQSLRGGYLLGMATFSAQDAGSGPADYAVFMTSEGEYLVYAGFDPANAANWTLVGRYYSSPPIGRKGWFQFRSDVYIICDEGVVAFAEIRSNGETIKDVEYLSSKLGVYYTDKTQYRDTQGWQAVEYPRGNMLIVNTPNTGSLNGEFEQFVMNTGVGTNPWSRFKDWNGISWCVFNRRLYFGTYDGKIMLADDGLLDDGAPIKCNARQAYNYFTGENDQGQQDKQFHFATFVTKANGTPPLSAEINVNFEDTPPEYTSALSGSDGAEWDMEFWDVGSWGSEGTNQTWTVAFGKLGYTGSIWLRAYLDGTKVQWYATRLVYEKTKGIVIL